MSFAAGRLAANLTAHRALPHQQQLSSSSAPPQRLQRQLRRSSGQDNGGSSDGPSVISEDVLARLRAAEAEAATLRAELQEARSQATAQDAEEEEEAQPPKRAPRIDGGDLKRETLFSGGDNSWLRESDVGFFTGGAPGEQNDPNAVTPEQQATVQRRLVIGLALSAAAAAFAVVPTEQLRASKPGRPQFFYLVPVMRSLAALERVDGLVEEERFDELTVLVRGITGQPNSLRQNLLDAAALLEDARATSKATSLANDASEYAQQVDYNKYFESMRGASPSGAQRQQYSDFSRSSAKAAREKLTAFLALMPSDQVEAARLQLSSSPF